MAGSSTGVSSLRKREAPGILFLDCPHDVLTAPLDKVQKPRLICRDGDYERCFGIRKGGVEGTMVHMPDDCGAGSWARAVALEPSEDQRVPVEIALDGGPVSAVYDFYFDYNTALVCRDAGTTTLSFLPTSQGPL